MVVAVYPRLGELLQQRNLTVAELQHQIETRFGLPVDRRALHRLTYHEAIRRVELDVAAAAAAVLGVGLSDLFAVEASPIVEDAGDLTAEEYSRLAELFDQQGRRSLSEAEHAELERLVFEAGRRLVERLTRQYAERAGMTVEAARQHFDEDLERRLARWQAREDDAAWRRKIVRLARGVRQPRGAA